MSAKKGPKWYQKTWVVALWILLVIVTFIGITSSADQHKTQPKAPQAAKKTSSAPVSEKRETGLGISAQQSVEALYGVRLDYKFSQSTLSDGTSSLTSNTANPIVELLGDKNNLNKVDVLTLKTGDSGQEADGNRAMLAVSALFGKEIKDWTSNLLGSRSGTYREVKVIGHKTYILESRGGELPSLSFSASFN